VGHTLGTGSNVGGVLLEERRTLKEPLLFLFSKYVESIYCARSDVQDLKLSERVPVLGCG